MTDAATKARQIAQSCEAKKHALRQTQDGIVVSFVLHPSEVPPSLQLAALGTRYMLALVEIGDDEQPKPTGSTANAVQQTAMTRTETPSKPASADTPKNPAPTRAPRKWREIDYPQQAGLLCQDAKFRRFLAEHDKCIGIAIYDLDTACDRVREICEVQSRTEIRAGTKAENRWNLLVSAYRAWEMAPSAGAA